MELGQDRWPKQPVAKVRGPIVPVIRDHIGITNVARQCYQENPRIEPRSLMMGSKQVYHWTSGTVYEGARVQGAVANRPDH
jgi:hypothetical protein